jgi:hypothetical protein
LSLSVAQLVTGSAAQAAVSSLSGETLHAGTAYPGTSFEVADCSGDANQSTASFSVSGIATGPYPGTFTATGTLTETYSDPSGGPVTSFTEKFTIQSPSSGTITGSKTLAAPSTALGLLCPIYCDPITGLCPITFSSETDNVYEANIQTPAGSAMDSGTSHTSIAMQRYHNSAQEPDTANFEETFQSTGMKTCEENSQDNQNQNGNSQGCKNP